MTEDTSKTRARGGRDRLGLPAKAGKRKPPAVFAIRADDTDYNPVAAVFA